MCKYSDEIQSMYFGSSRRQISLHTGVIYKDSDTVVSFCTASDNLKHGPAAIWAHMDRVLKHITQSNNYKTIHFISDGPTTQYRNKTNIFLWNSRITKYGVKFSTWNTLRHDMGNGRRVVFVGRSKRAADQQVLLKKRDITCAKDFVELLTATDTTIKVFIVTGKAIADIEATLPAVLKPVPNMMKIHQVCFTG